MHKNSKIALALLSLAIACSPAMAQGPQQGPPPQMQAPGGYGSEGPRWSGKQQGFMQRNDGIGGAVMRDFDRGPDGGPGGWGGGRGMRRGRGPMGMREHGMGRGGFGLSRVLNNPDIRHQIGVSDEQAAKIRQQESDFRKAGVRQRADLEVKQMDLRDLLSADKPDRTAIDSKLQDISTSRLAMEKSAIDFRLDMKDALTPDQRQKLQQLMQQRRQPGPRGNGNAGPRGPRAGGRGGAPGGATRPPANSANSPGNGNAPTPPPPNQ